MWASSLFSISWGDYQENILMVKILVIQDMLYGQIDLKKQH